MGGNWLGSLKTGGSSKHEGRSRTLNTGIKSSSPNQFNFQALARGERERCSLQLDTSWPLLNAQFVRGVGMYLQDFTIQRGRMAVPL